MKKYIRNRLLQLIPILLGITFLSFLLMQSSAMDAVDVMEQNTGGVMSEEEKEAVRAELGLDKPLPEQAYYITALSLRWVRKSILLCFYWRE